MTNKIFCKIQSCAKSSAVLDAYILFPLRFARAAHCSKPILIQLPSPWSNYPCHGFRSLPALSCAVSSQLFVVWHTDRWVLMLWCRDKKTRKQRKGPEGQYHHAGDTTMHCTWEISPLLTLNVSNRLLSLVWVVRLWSWCKGCFLLMFCFSPRESWGPKHRVCWK